MEEAFSVTTEENKSYTICRVFGSVLSTSFKVFQHTLQEALLKEHEKNAYFVVDFSQVTMFTSTCLNVIISLNDTIMERNWELIIISPSDDVSDLLEVSGFNKIYPVFSSLDIFLKDKGITK